MKVYTCFIHICCRVEKLKCLCIVLTLPLTHNEISCTWNSFLNIEFFWILYSPYVIVFISKLQVNVCHIWVCLHFKKDLFIWMGKIQEKKRGRERSIEIATIHWFSLSSDSRTGWGPPSCFPLAAENQFGFWCYKQWLNTLCHNTSPSTHILTTTNSRISNLKIFICDIIFLLRKFLILEYFRFWARDASWRWRTTG